MTNDLEFLVASLDSLGIHHDRLLDLVEAVVAYEDLFDALRLLQVCGV